MNDFDSPWKEALDGYFQAFMAFFFPQAYAEIDWSRGYEFLDKELQQILKEAELGRRVVDKLVKVQLNTGDEEWLLIHIEIQTQVETNFAERVFVYGYRLYDRYNRKVVSLAVLADDSPNWKPNAFGYSMWGYEIGVQFPAIKLLEYVDRMEELAAHDNPFAIVVLAHLQALQTRRDPHDRRVVKLALVKRLYERGWSGDDIRKLFRFIDWIMDLPDELAKSFWQEFHAYEEEKKMPFITSVERIGIEKGMEIGMEKGMEKGRSDGRREMLIEAMGLDVERKFPEEAERIMEAVRQTDNVETLRAALRAIKTIQSSSEFLATLVGGSDI